MKRVTGKKLLPSFLLH